MKTSLKLAFDLILCEVDENKQIKNTEDMKFERISMDLLEEIGVDYSKDIKRVHIKGSDLYNDLLTLMQDTILQTKVVKALINKGLITKENVYGVDLTLLLWQVWPGSEGLVYQEYGNTWVNSELDIFSLVGVEPPQYPQQEGQEVDTQ